MSAEGLEEEPSAPRFDRGSWLELISYTRAYRKERAGLVAMAVGLGALETAYPLLTRAIIDDLADPSVEADLRWYALAYAGLVAGIAAAVWTFIVLAGRIRSFVSHDIRRAAFVNLQRLSFSFYDRRAVGWLMARMTSDCERLSNILAWGILDMVWGATLLAGITLAMLLLNWKLALIVLSVLPFLVVLSFFFQRRILRTARQTRRWNSRLTASYNEGVMGLRTTKSFARERASGEEFRSLSTGMYRSSVHNALLSALYLPIVTTVGAVAVGLALQRGGVEVAAGALSLGTMVAFMNYAARFFEPLQELAHWFAEMQMAQASAERVLGVIHERPQIQDSPAVRARAADGEPPESPIEVIEFRGVQFSYVEGEPVLRDLDLRVPAGQTIALVGSTGGGKTTLVSLLCRFYDPSAGAVCFDGVDLRERPLRWVQSQMGVVLQAPQLFRGTVRDNLRYGRPEASDEEVEAAARAAGLLERPDLLREGLDTEVGEAGRLLSSGVRQLVSLARALVKDPQILILDEATSSVDTETELIIQAALARLLPGRTAFVIAHRLSTIRSADRILVVEDGRIVEDGDHDALLARGGRYAELWAQQNLRESARGAWGRASSRR